MKRLRTNADLLRALEGPGTTEARDEERASADDRGIPPSTVNESVRGPYHGKGLLPDAVPAVTKVLQYSALTGTPRAILVAIASYARPDGTMDVSPGQLAIAHRAGVDERTTRRWLKPDRGLLASGELEIPHRGGRRRGDTHIYFIALIPKVEKGDSYVSALRSASSTSKGDTGAAKPDISGTKGDTHVSGTQVVKTGLSTQAGSFFSKEDDNDFLAAAPSPLVGKPRPEPPADNGGDEAGYVSREQMAADLKGVFKKVPR